MDELTKSQKLEIVAAELAREADRIAENLPGGLASAEVGFDADGEARLVIRVK